MRYIADLPATGQYDIIKLAFGYEFFQRTAQNLVADRVSCSTHHRTAAGCCNLRNSCFWPNDAKSAGKLIGVAIAEEGNPESVGRLWQASLFIKQFWAGVAVGLQKAPIVWPDWARIIVNVLCCRSLRGSVARWQPFKD